MNHLLVINAGSSSLKFALFEAPPTGHREPRFRGQIDGLNSHAVLRIKDRDGATLVDSELKTEQGADRHVAALDALIDWLESQRVELAAVGHRVVHGGDSFLEPVLVTEQVLAGLEALIPLAPLHQPHNVRPMRVLAQRFPSLPQIACFDTAFHRTQDRLAQIFALPRALTDKGIKRYGFHGLSYEFIATCLHDALGEKAEGAVLVAHLGNGASITALRERKSVATTMGFTAADGLMMGTRTGSIDPGVILHLIEQEGYDAERLNNLIYRESGLLGVSGISADMRTLEASDSPHAREAIDLFCYRAAREAASLAAAMCGLDAIVFTGGIGEHSASVRAGMLRHLAWLGAVLDPIANSRGKGAFRLDAANSRVAMAVIPTNEEWMIARHTGALLAL